MKISSSVVRGSVWLPLLVVGLLLAASFTALGTPSGGADARVVDSSATGKTAHAGQRNFVVQTFYIEDQGAQTASTEIEFICVTKKDGSTLSDRYIRQLKLFIDDEAGSQSVDPELDGSDVLLGIIRRPDLDHPLDLETDDEGNPLPNRRYCFGRSGRLLVHIDNGPYDATTNPGAKVNFLLVADFSYSAPDLLGLQTIVHPFANDGLHGGADVSNSFKSGSSEFAVGEMVTIDNTADHNSGAQVIPEPNDIEVEIGGTTGVIGQFQIEDYGGDDHPTLVEHITLLLTGKRVDGEWGDEEGLSVLEGIRFISIYKESGGTTPGFQPQDRLIGRLYSPMRLGEVATINDEKKLLLTFGYRGRKLLHILDPADTPPGESVERIYVVANLGPDFQNDDQISLEVIVGARDMGGESSSAFDINPAAPIPAYNPVTIRMLPPTIILPDVTVSSSGKLTVSLKNIPAPGLDNLTATFVYDLAVADVALDTLGNPKVRALGNYEVLMADFVADGLFVMVGLKPGRKAMTGDFDLLEIEFEAFGEAGEETEITVDPWTLAAEDTDANPLILDVSPGKVEVRLIKGDVDFDSLVTRRDAREVARFIVGTSSLTWTELRQKAADVVAPFCTTYPTEPTVAPACIDASDVRAIMLAAYGMISLGQTAALAVDPLQVNAIVLTQGINGYTLAVNGQGIASTHLQLYSLAGDLVLDKEAMGNTLQFQPMNERGEALANGVYLYVVTVKGYNAETWRSEVRKLVVLR